MQSATREIERGPHTVRSHGFSLARTHMHDWLILVLLGAITLGLSIIHPFQRFVGREMMSDFRFPHKNDTIPSWVVPIYSILLPIVVFVLLYYRRRDVYDLHHAILGVLFSGLITGVLTEAIKNAVGRPTPDFFWRCFPDGNDIYDHWGGVICHGDEKLITAGYKSSPSGHTSWSFAGLGFLSLYLAGKMKAFDHAGHVAKLCVVLLPLLVSCLIGISRVDDYRHHWEDVFGGGLLGLVVATLSYLQFFPPPYHLNGWRTYAYLRVLEDVRPITDNAHSGGDTETQRSPRNNASTDANSGIPVSDIETGTR